MQNGMVSLVPFPKRRASNTPQNLKPHHFLLSLSASKSSTASPYNRTL
jgi:hypothetical protein